MPASRFVKYIKLMNEACERPANTEYQRKVDKLKETLTEEEYEKFYG
ncbi:MAG: hypothetical protein WC301_07430 [Candidatus Omnitrophota bacterium]|jgi:hypothetical protein